MNSMGLLAILVWLVIPVVSGWMVTALARSQRDLIRKRLAITGGIALLIAPWIISSTVKWFYDQKVLELCAKDGGIKVYETVKLPSDQLSFSNEIRIPARKIYEPADITHEFYYSPSMLRLRSGNPDLLKLQFKVFRNKDSRLLGEAITYIRIGGDLPGPWMESSFSCPKNSDITDLNKKIFIFSK
jgi:hypothetical protein